MDVGRKPARVRKVAPAKINLYFEVLARRGDGFHEIESLMVPLDLTDELWLEPDPTGALTLACAWADGAPDASIYGALPTPEDNLAFRALVKLRDRAGIAVGGRLRLIKRIPAAAGLGGGSSDAAAALLAGNILWGLGWPLSRLSEIAAELGSDVPFFLERQTACCYGRGERVTPVQGLGCWQAVVVKPPVAHATAQVYAHCRAALQPGDLRAVVVAFQRGDRRAVRATCLNRLEGAAAVNSPWMVRLRHAFASLDGICAQMSGSGSSYFALFRSARHARRAAARLRGYGGTRVFRARAGTLASTHGFA